MMTLNSRVWLWCCLRSVMLTFCRLSPCWCLQADCVLAGNRRSVPWQPWQVFVYTLHIVTTMPRVNIITHCSNIYSLDELSQLDQYRNKIIFCSWTGKHVLNTICKNPQTQPLLYSFQYCLAYLPFLPCIWRKPIRFKMCLLKDYLCWFPPSFLSQPVCKCFKQAHCILQWIRC